MNSGPGSASSSALTVLLPPLPSPMYLVLFAAGSWGPPDWKGEFGPLSGNGIAAVVDFLEPFGASVTFVRTAVFASLNRLNSVLEATGWRVRTATRKASGRSFRLRRLDLHP